MATRFSLVAFADGVVKYSWVCQNQDDLDRLEKEIGEVIKKFAKDSVGAIWPQVNALQLVAERLESGN